LINQEFDAEAHQIAKKVAVKKEKVVEAKEYMKGTGVITCLDEAMPKGIIDRQYYFDMAQFCPTNHPFSPMCKVDFEAEKSPSKPTWTVYSMQLHVSQKELDLKETLRYKTLVVQVTAVMPDSIKVRWENTHQIIPTTKKEIFPDYRIKEGQLTIKVKG